MLRAPPKPKRLRFVTVKQGRLEKPAWMVEAPEPELAPISSLHPRVLPTEGRHELAPIVESVPPVASVAPSPAPAREMPSPPPAQGSAPPPPRRLSAPPLAAQRGSLAAAPRPSAAPPAAESQAPPGATRGGSDEEDRLPSVAPPAPGPTGKRPDTFIENLVPRAEEEATQAITSALEEAARQRTAALRLAEQELISLARAICRRVIGRELQLDPHVCVSLVQEGLKALGQHDQVSVRLGPFFSEAAEDLAQQLEARGVNAEVSVDPALSPYGCLIETAFGRVDESIETRLDQLLDALDEIESSPPLPDGGKPR